ncbi:hypothetical protein IKG05_01060 [Candidatus Saccharibacteria bacterium]|nr:hypothetical protein [Candidatus Saccharibacteria bacterium]
MIVFAFIYASAFVTFDFPSGADFAKGVYKIGTAGSIIQRDEISKKSTTLTSCGADSIVDYFGFRFSNVRWIMEFIYFHFSIKSLLTQGQN